MGGRVVVCGVMLAVLAVVQVAMAAEQPAAVGPDGRLPIPDKQALDKARQLVKDVFKDAYAQSRGADARLQLADKLIAQSEATGDDPTSSYAMLYEARELAIEAGDPRRAQQVAGAVAARFDVDAREVFVASLERMVARPSPSATKVVIAEAAVAPVDQALDMLRVDLARRFADVAMTAARKAKDAALLKRAAEAESRVAPVEQLLEAKQRAVQTLAKSPDDAAANLALGKYLCFVEIDLEGGLPCLAKGSDAALRELAAASLPQPQTPAALEQVAERWWSAAETAKGPDRTNLRLIAMCYYADALPGLTGLAKLKAEQRIDASRGSGVPAARVARARSAASLARQLLYRDEFEAPTSGWGENFYKGSPERWSGYERGRYFLDRKQPGQSWTRCGKTFGNFACAVTGRVVGSPGDGWGIALENETGLASAVVWVTNEQKLSIRPFNPRSSGPKLGPFDQPQASKGDSFNKLVLALRGSQFEVYLNGSLVREPIPLPDTEMARPSLVLICSGAAHAEFERVEVYRLPADNAAAAALARDLSKFGPARPAVKD